MPETIRPGTGINAICLFRLLRLPELLSRLYWQQRRTIFFGIPTKAKISPPVFYIFKGLVESSHRYGLINIFPKGRKEGDKGGFGYAQQNYRTLNGASQRQPIAALQPALLFPPQRIS